jgi:mannose-1-phosphate guanylyltransferase
VRAVVLVGGEGTRLRPLTLHTPKQLLPVAGIPMIERVVAQLARSGRIDGVVLSMGYRPDAFVDAYPDGRCAGVPITYAIEPELLDTAGAVRFAVRAAGVEGTFVVVNGDVLTALDVGEMVDFHRRVGAEATISLTAVDDPSRFGVVPTDADGRVLAFIEKPAPGEAPTNLINAGTYVLESSVVERIPDGRRVSIERETFPALVADGTLYAMASDAYWIDTGTPATYLQANLDAAEDQVLIGADVAVDPTAVLERAVIGARCRIDAGACVTESVLLDGVHVGTGATIARSLLGRRATVGARARVEELCVVGDGEAVEEAAALRGARVPG